MSIVGTRPPLISETNLYEPRHNELVNLPANSFRKINMCKMQEANG